MSNILEILEDAPEFIRTEGKKVVAAEKAYRLVKARLSAARNAYTLKYKDEKNTKIIEAYVENEEEVQHLVVEEIEAATTLKLATMDYDAVYNQWVSARKLGGMDEKEIQAISQSVIKGWERTPSGL